MPKPRTVLIILLSILIHAILALVLFNWINPVWWQDIKLASTRYWGLSTISNNPLLSGQDADLQETNYQDTDLEPRISIDKLFSGGPPKDGIPSIDAPVFEAITETDFNDDELIIGLEINGEVRAYPYAILNWHEIVNDTVGGVAVAITYCPLCETNSVFKRETRNQATGEQELVEFGVSGKLYESCLVMYDRTTDTLYNQVQGMGIVGSNTGAVLERVPAVRTTLGAWRTLHPNSQILTTETGHTRDYSRYPYGSYYTNEQIIFPVSRQEMREHPAKEITQIIFEHDTQTSIIDRFSGEYQAFTQSEIREQGEVLFAWQGSTATATWNAELDTIIFTDQDSSIIPNMSLFNFVLPAHFQ